MDQGVIGSLKAFYRHSIIKRCITSIDGGRSPTKVSMLEAIIIIIMKQTLFLRVLKVSEEIYHF